MSDLLAADTPMRRLSATDLRVALNQNFGSLRRQMARQLVARFCPMATSVCVGGEDEALSDGRVATTVGSVTFYDSQNQVINLRDPNVAWHVVQSSPELQGEFFLQSDYSHDPAGAAEWLEQELLTEQDECLDLVDTTIDVRAELTPSQLYRKGEDGSYKLVDESIALRLDAELDHYFAWLSAKGFVEKFAPMAAGVLIEYSAEYDDEGGYVSSVSDVIPIDAEDHPIEIEDPKVALECIKLNAELHDEYGDDDPEYAPEFLKDHMRDYIYAQAWCDFDRITLTDEPQAPEAYTPAAPASAATAPEEVAVELA